MSRVELDIEYAFFRRADRLGQGGSRIMRGNLGAEGVNVGRVEDISPTKAVE